MAKPEQRAPEPVERPKLLHTGPPNLTIVPARMINEVLYCERLMYLEWAQNEFADNSYTVEGRFAHRRADTPGGDLPPAEDQLEGVTYVARSLWLTSESLGLTARIDVVEADEARHVVPIEYKRGHAPDLLEGAYLPELAQVCTQVLLLREHGYRCDEGAIYFAKSKKRVPIRITQELIDLTLWAARVARELIANRTLPPPLDESPKCEGCSLNPICLPDEVNLLRRLDGKALVDPQPENDLEGPLDPDPWNLVGPTETPHSDGLRQIRPAREDRIPLYVTDHRSKIGLSGERLVISGRDGATHARLMNTSQVSIFGNAQITTQALKSLLERGIPLSFFSGGGWFMGRASGFESKNADLRLAQYRCTTNEVQCLALARALVTSKIKNCRTLLRRNHQEVDKTVLNSLNQLRRKAAEASCLDSLLGIEGAAARTYFGAFSGMLKLDALAGFEFEHRNRRPPRDPVNALLSLCYALLTREYTQTITTVGLDPMLGFYHQPHFGKPSLALDLMEEMRPILADSVVVGAINNGVVAPDDFVYGPGSCALKPAARKRMLAAYERRLNQTIKHPLFGYVISYRRVIEVQARLLSRVILGELEHYPIFTTR